MKLEKARIKEAAEAEKQGSGGKLAKAKEANI